WEAVMPAQAASMAELEAGGIRHFDQPGRMTGTVRLDGEQLDIDCYSLRDRTWGHQRFDQLPPGDYLWAIASPTDNWHAITLEDRPGGPDRVVDGYLVRDGIVAPLVSGSREVVARRSGRPTHILFEAVDNLGRHIEAEGRPRNNLHFTGWPGQFTYFC